MVTCDRTFTRISQLEIPLTLQSFSVQMVVHSMASCVSLTGSFIMFLLILYICGTPVLEN